MNNHIVWLDSNEALIFKLKTSGIVKFRVLKKTLNHHRRHKNDLHKDSHSDQYFQDIIKHLSESDRLIVLGPGYAKIKFKNYLEKKQKSLLYNKIIGIDHFEHLSEKKILEKAFSLFKQYDIFHSHL